MKIVCILMLLPALASAQREPVLTSFPTLTISASARGWGMGNTGIAGATGNQGLGYNVATTALTKNFHQASVCYMPWLPGVSSDTRFIHADYLGSAGASAIGFAISYLNMGTVAIRDNSGATLGLYRSSEYHIGASYALQLGGHTSLGATLRFLGNMLPGSSLQNTYSACGDLGFSQSFDLGDASKVVSVGAVVAHLGANIHLPATAGIGIAYTQHDPENSRLMFSLDASRLLKEDLKGLHISAGGEYSFDGQFFLRGGVNLENAASGNRKFFSLGAGYKGFVSDQSYGLDVFYLVPFGVVAGVSPFQNAYGFTLSLNIGNFQ